MPASVAFSVPERQPLVGFGSSSPYPSSGTYRELSAGCQTAGTDGPTRSRTAEGAVSRSATAGCDRGAAPQGVNETHNQPFGAGGRGEARRARLVEMRGSRDEADPEHV